MKKLIIILTVIVWGVIGSDQLNAHPGVSRYFYTALTPYGQWIEIDYGVVVWKPVIMDVNWSPYTQGRWIWTVDGWYWQSYEPFGYIAYHYGRWYYDDYYGWIWVPGYEYAPAWVEWRYDDVYIGWAPLPPYATFSVSVGIYYTRTYYTPYNYWTFVNYNYFYDPYVYRHCVAPRYKYRIYSHTQYRTNYTYYNGRVRNYGVDVNVIRTRGGQNIRQRDIIRTSDVHSLDRNGSNNNGSIRTFYLSRDDLKRNEVRNVDFKRGDRKTTLDVSKIRNSGFTRENYNERKRFDKKKVKRNNSFDKNRENITKDNKRDITLNKNNNRYGRNDVHRTEKTRNNVNRNNELKTQKKNEVKRNVNFNKKRTDNKNRVTRKNTVRTTKTVRRNTVNKKKKTINTRTQNRTKNNRDVKKNRKGNGDKKRTR